MCEDQATIGRESLKTARKLPELNKLPREAKSAPETEV